MRKLMIVMLLAALASAVTAQAGATPIQSGVVVVRVIDSPTFLPTTSRCPFEHLHIKLRSSDGKVIGATDACYQSAEVSGLVETLDLIETFDVPGGSIETHQTFVATFASDFSIAAVATGGTVTRGTGVYLGAAGTVAGGGTLGFHDGAAFPDLTFTMILS